MDIFLFSFKMCLPQREWLNFNMPGFENDDDGRHFMFSAFGSAMLTLFLKAHVYAWPASSVTYRWWGAADRLDFVTILWNCLVKAPCDILPFPPICLPFGLTCSSPPVSAYSRVKRHSYRPSLITANTDKEPALLSNGQYHSEQHGMCCCSTTWWRQLLMVPVALRCRMWHLRVEFGFRSVDIQSNCCLNNEWGEKARRELPKQNWVEMLNVKKSVLTKT